MTPTTVFAVEISGACNLESFCSWCPMHNRPRSRKRGLMDDATVKRSLYWVNKLPRKEFLHLHNFGEPLLHPKFDEIALEFSKLNHVTFSTNAVFLDEKWADRLAKIPWAWISVSPWKPEAVDPAIKLLTERNIPIARPPGITHNWAGQSVIGPTGKIFNNCPFLIEAKPVIRWNGDLVSCCISDREEDAIGHINREPEEIKIRGYDICAGCHHAVS